MNLATMLVMPAVTLSLACSAPEAQPVNLHSTPDPGLYVWWEAEDAVATNMSAQFDFAPANADEAAVLSGGTWIGAGGQHGETKFAEYEVTVPEGGQYHLYVRKFWKHGPYRWRFNDGPWTEIGGDVALLDGVQLRQFLVANWTPGGPVELEAGTHRFRIELTVNEGAAAFDAFILTRGAFLANGKLRPGERYGTAPEGWFAFEPDPDSFRESPLDLRWLNEAFAGEHGHIRVEGDQFVNDAGPIRFWAVNAGPDVVRMDRPSVDYLARWLAKNGVNMVRYHGAVFTHNPNEVALDESMIESVQYFVAAMKREGIYVGLSIYFPLWLNAYEAQGLAGYSGQHPFGIQFFGEVFNQWYRAWWRELLTRENPHTGMTLAADPAVAYAELVNEDSYFFWTFTPYNNVPEAQMATLERQFAGWLRERYGSPQAALDAWGGDRIRGDLPEQGRIGILNHGRDGRSDQRAQDTVRFLAEDQRAWFEANERFLKEELGFQGLVHGSNWITADARVLGPVDKWTNTANDFMDRHGYFDPLHQGDMASYSLNAGERFVNASKLLFQGNNPVENPNQLSFGNPIADLQYNGMPSMISEVNWPMPNRFRTEFAPLAAAYGSLQGSNAIVHFALSGPSWMRKHSKFPIAIPTVMGQFPALALMYRRGDVTTAEAAVEVTLNLGDMFALRGGPVEAPQNLEALRAADVQVTAEPSSAQIDPRAFWVGRVKKQFSDGPGSVRTAPLGDYISDETRTIRSLTGELNWNWGDGIVRVNTERAQGAFGFLAASRIDLKDVVIATDMEYASVFVVSLDGQPVAESSRMLLQVMTEDKPYGWTTTEGPMFEIVSTGQPPIVVREARGTITWNRPDASALRITALDLNGYPIGEVGRGDGFPLRPNVLYYLVER